MSPLAGAVVLAWGCLAVLTLAMAGMLRQLRELQAELARLRAPAWRAVTTRRFAALAGAQPALILVLDPGCGFCDAVHEPFTRLAREYPETRFEVLSPRPRWPATPAVPARVDEQLVAELDLPWAPALLHAGPDGTVLHGAPVAHPDALEEQVRRLLGAVAHPQGTR
jgi:hypothetical protein